MTTREGGERERKGAWGGEREESRGRRGVYRVYSFYYLSTALQLTSSLPLFLSRHRGGLSNRVETHRLYPHPPLSFLSRLIYLPARLYVTPRKEGRGN